jgi:predicted nucleic acid-binding protein
MQLYLDTSALVKLVVVEAESAALRSYLDECASDIRISAALARTELVRAVAMHRAIELIENARRIIARLHLVALSNKLLDAAATMMPPELRTLDAIHLAAALTAPELRAVVTYDSRLGQAAADAGLVVVAPGT